MIDYIFLEKYTENINVLFVEDDDSIRKSTRELLEDIFQKKIITAKDGKEGFEKYIDFYKQNNRYFDLVITDIEMPNMDGIELTKLIYNENHKQPLIVLSAHNESEYLMDLVNIGISQFILKPIQFENFTEIIYKVSKDIYMNSKDNEEQSIPKNIIHLAETLIWDKNKKQLFLENQAVKLTKKEYLFFELLLKTPEKTSSNEEIMFFLWKDDEDKQPDISNLKNIISRLRKKVPSLKVENIYGLGYKISTLS